MSETPVQQRLQITFGKFGALKYTGNLDVAKVWERVLRRANLPILYTQGFNTRPRIQLATTLPLGITSECELLDLALRKRLETLDGLPERIMAVSPAGLRVYRVEEVPIKNPAPQSLVRSAEYRILFEAAVPDLIPRIEALLARDRILREEKDKRGRKSMLDLRPLIHELQAEGESVLLAHLAAGERGNLRPHDVILELDLGEHYYQAHRYRLHMENYNFHTLR